jgi:hypothetical protein
MANSLTTQILLDGWRNAVVKLTGVLDTMDANEQSVIAPSMFSNNETISVLTGFRVDRLTYVIGQGIEIQLQWNGSSQDQTIVAIAGRGVTDNHHYGGWQPNQTLPGYDGSINLVTTGYGLQPIFGTVQNFTIVIEMTKLYK